jgi:hypothetical protein
MEVLQWKGIKIRILDLKHADVRPGDLNYQKYLDKITLFVEKAR